MLTGSIFFNLVNNFLWVTFLGGGRLEFWCNENGVGGGSGCWIGGGVFGLK